jgi:hypothetical protein
LSKRPRQQLLRSIAIFPVFAHLALLISVSPANSMERCNNEAITCCSFFSQVTRSNLSQHPLGMQIWPGEFRSNQNLYRSLIELRPSHLRFAFGPSWRVRQPLSEQMTDDELDRYVASGYRSSPDGDQTRATVVKIKQDTGAVLHLMTGEPPPMPGESDFRRANAPKARILKREYATLAARFYVADIRYLQMLGVPFDAAEISNEPDGNWNIQIEPTAYLDLIRNLRSEAKRRGIILPKIYGPGASRAETARIFFANPEVARGIMDAVDVVSFHAWDDKAGKDRIDEYKKFRAQIASLGRNPEIAITEYAVSRPILGDSSSRMDVDNRLPDSVAMSTIYPAASLRDLLRLYGENIGTIIYWEFKDETWGVGLFGLLDVAGAPKPIYFAYKSLTESFAKLPAPHVVSSSDGRLAILTDGPRPAFLIAVNPSEGFLDVVVDRNFARIVPATEGCLPRSPMDRGLRLRPGEILQIPLSERH